MVSWGWIPLALFIGVCIGIVLIGIVSVNEEDKRRKWDE